jgi:hypothetical protein
MIVSRRSVLREATSHRIGSSKVETRIPILSRCCAYYNTIFIPSSTCDWLRTTLSWIVPGYRINFNRTHLAVTAKFVNNPASTWPSTSNLLQWEGTKAKIKPQYSIAPQYRVIAVFDAFEAVLDWDNAGVEPQC